MKKAKNAVEVQIQYFDGHDEGDDGIPYYVASCDELMFTTEGETFEALLHNIRECLILCLRDNDSVAEYGVAPDAHVTLTMDLPQDYAQTA